MIKTYIPNKYDNFIEKKWFVIDANNQKLGRLATKISQLLLGKEESIYTPFFKANSRVIVINAEKIFVTGKKEYQKIYYNHSGTPGGMKTKKLFEVRKQKPEQIVHQAVKNMLPKNTLGRQIRQHLKIYKGDQHPHQSQNPELLKIIKT